MLWLAIFLPDFIVDCCRLGAPPDDAPLAVCESSKLIAVNERAAQSGVLPGIAPATALALLPDIHLIERQIRQESAALHGLAQWALQFTPQVSVQHCASDNTQAGLLLDIGASLTLFGGLGALITRVRAGVTDQGLHARLACAPTPAGAWMLARHRNGLLAEDPARLSALLARLPVRLLDTAQAHAAALQAVGVHTLGDLQQLPRAGVAQRFGPPLLRELDRALGLTPDPRALFEAPACFESCIELPAPVEDAERLLFAARRLLLQLCGWLAGRQSGARRITLFAEHERRAATPIAFGSDQPSRQIDQWVILLGEALRRCQLPAATSSLRLLCNDVHEYIAPDGELFPGALGASEQLGRLLDRLKARLGDDHINQIHLVAEHRPEYAWRAQPASPPGPETARGQSNRSATSHRPASSRASNSTPTGTRTPASSRANQAPPGTSPGLRPLWLLDPPIALSERNNRPFWESPLSLLAGPERIESGWWDDSLVLRDYFIAEDSSHRLLWIFRERHPAAGSGWYLHGRFG